MKIDDFCYWLSLHCVTQYHMGKMIIIMVTIKIFLMNIREAHARQWRQMNSASGSSVCKQNERNIFPVIYWLIPERPAAAMISEAFTICGMKGLILGRTFLKGWFCRKIFWKGDFGAKYFERQILGRPCRPETWNLKLLTAHWTGNLNSFDKRIGGVKQLHIIALNLPTDIFIECIKYYYSIKSISIK